MKFLTVGCVTTDKRFDSGGESEILYKELLPLRDRNICTNFAARSKRYRRFLIIFGSRMFSNRAFDFGIDLNRDPETGFSYRCKMGKFLRILRHQLP